MDEIIRKADSPRNESVTNNLVNCMDTLIGLSYNLESTVDRANEIFFGKNPKKDAEASQDPREKSAILEQNGFEASMSSSLKILQLRIENAIGLLEKL